jgi:hypothetical protein
MHERLKPRLQRTAICTALLLMSALAFWMYLQPEFLVTLSEQIWACF